MTVPAGTRYGVYEIVAPLGAGGMGEVYKARDPRLDRLVALKTLPREFANDATARERFEREAWTASALNHPNILSVFDVGRDAGTEYLVTELVEGTIARFPSGEGKWDVSRGTGTMPRWSATGDRLFFVDDLSRIVEADVELTPSFSAGPRRVAVDARAAGANPARDGFDRSLDGQRFLVARSPIETRRLASIHVVENWLAVYGGAR